ncbi:F0F1 ATP synthase subunit gamma [Pseudomonas sp.]|uniref:F0F1 ATP synthase subunit gamma n=1 Tax=Pseudomonas sp. TaxID=306 RepID=UPI003D0C129C
MSSRLGEVAQHLATTRELAGVIAAMRGIAAARSREAQQRLLGVRAYAATLGQAIGEGLGLLGESERPAPLRNGMRNHLLLVFCAEQGFVGTFNERLLAVAAERLQALPGDLLVVGARGQISAAEHGLRAVWSAPMPIHPDEVQALAGRIAEAIYARLDPQVPTRVSLVHGVPGQPDGRDVLARSLLPFDYSRFPIARSGRPPLVNLEQGQLVAQLAEEYVYAELCEALMLSFAAENEARMHAMIAAQENIGRRREELQEQFRRIRQDEITDEIIELSSQRLF